MVEYEDIIFKKLEKKGDLYDYLAHKLENDEITTDFFSVALKIKFGITIRVLDLELQ